MDTKRKTGRAGNDNKFSAKKPLNLALQGGGAHGAFTWGVLDYLLEDGGIDFEGITATSAGAMNAAALAYGKATGGNEKAREVLEHFWWETAQAGAVFSPVRRTPLETAMALNPFMPNWSLEYSPYFALFETVTRSISPYQFNPLNVNLLRQVLKKTIQFKRVHECDCLKLFVTATNVRTGTPTIFENRDVTIDVLLASAALPTLFHAIKIKKDYYWDGGYMGNPSLWPLFYHARCRDILIVHVNPIVRKDLPRESYTIENRLNEISFNASLLKELRAISFVKKLINEDMLKDEYKDRYKDMLIHAIRTDSVMESLSVASKFDTDWRFLTYLRDLGRAEAGQWLKNNRRHIGKEDTVDIERDYLNCKSPAELTEDVEEAINAPAAGKAQNL